MSSVENLQRRIDAQAYPPTHTYRIGSGHWPWPTGVLAGRVALLDQAAPDFFRAGLRLLDVGCNKGYFTARGVAVGMRVTAIDTELDAVELCRDLAPGARVLHTGVRELVSLHRYDRIFLGNVHHYSFVEAGHSYAYLYKLAALAEDDALVVIEGPLGMECRDMARVLPRPEHAARFNQGSFLAHAARAGFRVWTVLPTVSHTPDRYIVVLKRTPRLRHPFELRGLEVVRREERKLVVGITPAGFAVKVAAGGMPVSEQIAVELAAHAPHSNGMLGWVERGGEIVGWMERRLTTEPLKFFERTDGVLQACAENNLFLSRCGYVDPDPGTINWAPAPDGHGLICFDKNAVMPCAGLSAPFMARVAQCYRNSYRNPLEGLWIKRVVEAMETRSSFELERVLLTGVKDAGPHRQRI